MTGVNERLKRRVNSSLLTELGSFHDNSVKSFSWILGAVNNCTVCDEKL